MSATENLSLAEQILLLSLNDKDGSVHSRVMHFQHILAAAVVAELLLSGRVALSDDGKNRLEVIDERSFSVALLDDTLAKIKDKPGKNIPHWVRDLVYPGDIKQRVAQNLCEQGILQAQESTILFFIRNDKYPQLQGEFEDAVIARLRRAILSNDSEIDERTTLLISLANKARVLPLYFENAELQDSKQHLQDIVEGKLSNSAVVDAAGLASISAAVVAATVAV